MVKPLGYPKETTPSVHGSWPVSCGEARLRLGWRLRFGRPRLDPAHGRPSPCHAAGIFQPPWGEQRWGDAKNWKTCCWVGFAIHVWWDCGDLVLGCFWEQRWIDFCEHKSVLYGGRVFVQSKRLRFFEWTDTLNSEAELGWDAKTRKCSSPLKVEQNCPALWRIKGPKVPHFRRGIPLGRT